MLGRGLLALFAIVVVVAVVLVVRSVRSSGPSSGGRATGRPRPSGSIPGTAGTVLRVSPQPSGARNGRSWTDAAGLGDLPKLLRGIDGGAQVWLRADSGPFPVTSTVAIGGGSRGSVLVRGANADGSPAKAVLRGDRATPYSATGRSGTDAFWLMNGAAHLTFRDLAFQDVGDAFRATGNVTDIAVTDITATNVRRLFDDNRSAGQRSADVVGLTLQRIVVTGFSKRVLQLGYGSRHVLLEDVIGDSQQQDGDNFAIGVHLQDAVHDVTLRRVTIRNIRDTLHTYWNGDGFATERAVHDVRFQDTLSQANTDAGYDLKSTRTVLTDAVAAGNKRNYRFWAADLVAQRSQGIDPHRRGGSSSQAQVWLGKGARVRLDACTFRDSDPQTVVFDLEPGAHLDMHGGSVRHRGMLQRLTKGAAAVLTRVTGG